MPTIAATFALAVQQQRSGNVREAERLFRVVLEAEPRHTDALNRLGAIAAMAGAFDAAIEYFRRAIELAPLEPQFHRNIGTAYKDAGRVEDAVRHYREALRLDAGSVSAHVNLAEVLAESGDLERAIAHNQAALRLDPRSARAYCNLGELAVHGRYQFPEENLLRLEELAARSDLSAADASLFHFTLAALLDRQSAYEKAFHHYRRGNDLKREVYRQHGQEFDRDRHRRLVDGVIATFTREFFEKKTGLGNASDVPLFVVGMVRSGTTLVEQILASHPQVRGAGELRDMEQIARALPERLATTEGFPQCMSALTEPATRTLAEIYLRRLTAAHPDARHVVDKMPHNFVYLGLIATLFPKARVVNCRRDPLDLGASIYFQNFKWMPYAATFEDIVYFYTQYERLMAHWSRHLPLPVHDVAYEDLVADPGTVSRKLIEFCGLAWDERCLEFHKTPRTVQTASKLQVRRPIYRTSVGRWKPYEAQLKPLLDAFRETSRRGSLSD
jgi:tetratricopeptide (TPR) repeat protein